MKDIYLKPTEDGPDLLLINGLPQLTGGLDNMVYILLMTGAWWGNTTGNDDSLLTSDIPRIMREGTLTNKTRLDIISEATRVLQIMLALGIADTITVEAEIPNRGTLYLSVKLDEPDSDETTNFIYALNWDAQKVGIINSEPEEAITVWNHVLTSDSNETFISEIGEVFVSDSYIV